MEILARKVLRKCKAASRLVIQPKKIIKKFFVNKATDLPSSLLGRVNTSAITYADQDYESNGRLWPWNYQPEPFPATLTSGKPWPKISVVTVCYNQGNFLEETIRSVILQGYPNLEYFVIDGASTDNTKDILRRYSSELTGYISEPDNGQSHALNKGFRQTSGDIMCWLNSDDQHLPNTLRQIAEAFDRHQTDLIVGNTLVVRDYIRQPLHKAECIFPYNQIVTLPFSDIVQFKEKWLKGHYFYQPEVFWTREIWNKVGPYINEFLSYAMDYELWLRMAWNQATICHIPDPVAKFRLHAAQKTKVGANIQYPEHEMVAMDFINASGSGLSNKNISQATNEKKSKTEKQTEDLQINLQETFPPEKFSHKLVKFYETATGNYYLPADVPFDTIVSSIRTGRIFEEEIVSVARQFIIPGSTVLDIGSNLGQMAILFSKMTGPQGSVLAFEADDFIFSLLQKNIEANNCENVRAFYGAIFDKSGETVYYPEPTFERFSAYGSYGLDLNAKQGRHLQTLTIDELEIQSPISFMKVDIQGSDLFALRGAEKTIAKHQMPIIFEFEEEFQEEFKTSFQDYIDFIRSISYKVKKVVNNINYLIVPDEKISVPISFKAHAQESTGSIHLSSAPHLKNVCKFLKSKDEINECTNFLYRNGFKSHHLQCKDWDIAHIVSMVEDGNFLDMGSSDSYILKNLSLKRIKGEKYGIDFDQPDVPISDVKYLIGDLMQTGLPDNHFKNISCLSVLEHEVDFVKFAREVNRLLQQNGRLFVTFDYWDPKITSPIRLFDLAWQPLDKQMVLNFIETCKKHNLHLLQDFDWTLGDSVINWGYYSPHPTMAYTFGMAVFEKRN